MSRGCHDYNIALERYKRECIEVKRLGEQIGYGNMMTIASALWALEEDDGAFYPTILPNMKEGELTDCEVQNRKNNCELFKQWGW